MSCCDTTTTAPPPGSGCLSLAYQCQCIAGVDTWVLNGVPACVANAACVPLLTCTPTDCIIQLINGCVIADPLPPLPVPWCPPSCCVTPPPTFPPDTTTTTPPPTYPPDETTTTAPPPTFPPPPETTTTAPPTYPPPETTTTAPPPTTTTTTPPPPSEYCNCDYESTWDCGLGAWTSPTLVSACTTDATDNSTAWGYKDGEACVAEITVSAEGACDP